MGETVKSQLLEGMTEYGARSKDRRQWTDLMRNQSTSTPINICREWLSALMSIPDHNFTYTKWRVGNWTLVSGNCGSVFNTSNQQCQWTLISGNCGTMFNTSNQQCQLNCIPHSGLWIKPSFSWLSVIFFLQLICLVVCHGFLNGSAMPMLLQKSKAGDLFSKWPACRFNMLLRHTRIIKMCSRLC